MQKTTKFVKETLVTGIGLGVGANLLGRAPDSTISKNAIGALGIASMVMPIKAASHVMDSFDILNKPKKRR